LIVKENDVEAAFAYAGDMPLARVDEAGNPVYYLTDAMGSIIGLVDGNGQEVAEFRYDSFGNLQTPEALPLELGGDFRFQGQWLESNTDLYHFRARYYDPETGRFVSRDPVEVIETVPESSNPYQFVYNNPLVYSDPTGEFTMVELQSGFATEKALNSIQLQLTNHARQYLIDKAKGVATNIFAGVAETVITELAQLNPLLNSALNEVLSNKQRNRLGPAWERLLKGEFKKIIEESFPEYLNAVWFEAEVSTDGTPQSDGLSLQSFDLKSKNGKNNPNPDFIIKTDGGPNSTDFAQGKGEKSYLIGDFKLSWHRVEKDKNKAQFKAMMNYASFSNRHQVVPIALYITMIGGDSTLGLHKVTKKAIQEHAVYPQFLTLFPNIKGWKK
jgi:RHS repeat-associated protein